MCGFRDMSNAKTCWTLQTEATNSCKMSVTIYLLTLLYLHQNHCESLNSYWSTV